MKTVINVKILPITALNAKMVCTLHLTLVKNAKKLAKLARIQNNVNLVFILCCYKKSYV